jgi:sterol 3beta-glucosyltransferase
VAPGAGTTTSRQATADFLGGIGNDIARAAQQGTDFLSAGPPPVFIGFGSRAVGSGEHLGPVVLAAIREAGVRAVVQSGWAEMSVADDDVLQVGDVPHEWLFPRMAAVVHHAGAGPAPVRFADLTPTRLASAIRAAVDDLRHRDRAQELRRLVNADDGAGAVTRRLDQLAA